jgi:hypothetical protein
LIELKSIDITIVKFLTTFVSFVLDNQPPTADLPATANLPATDHLPGL